VTRQTAIMNDNSVALILQRAMNDPEAHDHQGTECQAHENIHHHTSFLQPVTMILAALCSQRLLRTRLRDSGDGQMSGSSHITQRNDRSIAEARPLRHPNEGFIPH
jgi:hypothetical protein